MSKGNGGDSDDGDSADSGNSVIRRERQVYPSKTLGDMLRDI